MKTLERSSPRGGHLAASSYIAADLADLTEIYSPGVNVVVHPRTLDERVRGLDNEVANAPGFARSIRVRANKPDLSALWPEHTATSRELLAEVRFLAEVYAELFEASELGIRLASMHSAMCPRFHVDRVGVRLVCALVGRGTEWLDDACVDRAHIGRGEEDAADNVVLGPIFQMGTYDIGLLKGESWPGNIGRGAVHRSPTGLASARLFVSIEAL